MKHNTGMLLKMSFDLKEKGGWNKFQTAKYYEEDPGEDVWMRSRGTGGSLKETEDAGSKQRRGKREAVKQDDKHYLGKNVVFIDWISGGTGLVGRGQSECWCCSGEG